MTAKDLFEAIGLVDDDLIVAADAPAPRRRPALRWQWVPLAACLCLAVGILQTNGNLLGGMAGLAMPRSSSAADSATATEEMAPELSGADTAAGTDRAVTTDSDAGDASAGGLDAQAETAPEERAMTSAAEYPEAAEGAGAAACPVDADAYSDWALLDVNAATEEPLALAAGTLYLLADGEAPFLSEESLDEVATLNLYFAEAVEAEAGYAPEGGALAAQYQGTGTACSLMLPEDAAGRYYFYLVLKEDALVTAQPGAVVFCRVAPEK